MTASTIEVTITVDPGHASRLDDVVRALEAEGLSDIACHRRFLVVNGSIPAERLALLGKVAGVTAVREGRTYRASS